MIFMHVPHYQKDMAEMNTRLIERTSGLLSKLAETEKELRKLKAENKRREQQDKQRHE